MKKYKINEIFYSFQGEGTNTGMPAVFVRFAGCNRKCSFCDTDHSVKMELSAEELVVRIEELSEKHNCHTIIWTGGEPCLQLNSLLVKAFYQATFWQVLETNGTVPLEKDVLKCLQYVTISPKEEIHSMWFDHLLRYPDEIRIPVPSMFCLKPFPIPPHGTVFFSPVFDKEGKVSKENFELALEFVKNRGKSDARLSLQIHKLFGIK
jgi:organic radical activating enzyme